MSFEHFARFRYVILTLILLIGWVVFNSSGHIMAVNDVHGLPGFLITFFPNPPTSFLTCFSRGERRKYAGKKVRLNRVSKSHHLAARAGNVIN